MFGHAFAELFFPLLAIVLLFTELQPALGQTPQAAIVGTCLDPTGAATPGASVTARNTKTNAQFAAKTNESGNYILPVLPVGPYEVTATAQGFRAVVRSGIILQIEDRARVDFLLEVGVSEQKVDVVGQAPFNLTGSPAISIPSGFTRDGMPIGLQLVGRAFDDATVLRAAHGYQLTTGWHLRRPALT